MGTVFRILGTLAVSAAAAAAAPSYTVVLYVANQSVAVNPVDIKVTVDNDAVVEGAFYAGASNPWRRYELKLAAGRHTLCAFSRKGAAAYKRVFELTGDRWVGLAYRYAPPAASRDVVPRHFWVELRAKPWGR